MPLNKYGLTKPSLLAINQERGYLLVGNYSPKDGKCNILVFDLNALDTLLRHYAVDLNAMGSYMDVVSLPVKNGHPVSRLFVSCRNHTVVAYDLDI